MRKSKYDLDQLEVGESKRFPKSKSIAVSVSIFQRTSEKRFKTKTEGEETVITRVS